MSVRGDARVPDDTVVYAVGDIHGRWDLLQELHARIAADARRRAAPRKLLVYLGDYVSRGPDSRRVVEMVMGRAPPGLEAVPLKGNHEDMLLRFVAGDLDAGRHWFDYDGLDMLRDYGVVASPREAEDALAVEALRRRFAAALPAEHLAFFRGLRVSHDEGGYRFVHAGVRPGVPLAAQSDHDQMWIRGEFLGSDADLGAVIVHGHSISPAPDVRANRIGIDTGAVRSGVLTCLVLEGDRRAFLQTGA
jgi:calcineurin-like phosphoesterase family protein